MNQWHPNGNQPPTLWMPLDFCPTNILNINIINHAEMFPVIPFV
jgi:hypothetical protein